jgi:ABC-type sugar transport system ATPase subunit
MPTVTLRHVTKRYSENERGDKTNLNRVLASGARGVFDNNRTLNYLDQMRSSSEPVERQHAVDDLSLVIHNGETLCLLGPSGCGKTTLLKIIAGLIHPDSGDVLYDGESISDIPTGERGIGMVFQNYALYPHMEARDNIGFFDLVHRHPERIPQRIKHIVEVMGVNIEYLLSRKPPTLSGGEQQRVAIARCLARDPKIFLFDEPLSNLDAKLRTETRVQIKRLLDHYKITAVYVTHDQIEAIALADRIAVMRSGKIEQIGTYQSLHEMPVNAFVAQFLGTPPMNIFPGHIWNNIWEGKSFSIGPVRPALNQGQAVLLGIRPEHILLTENGIPAEVDYTEQLFTERRQLVYLQLAKQRCIASFPLDYHIQAKSTIQLSFPMEHLYLFDETTGMRIG